MLFKCKIASPPGEAHFMLIDSNLITLKKLRRESVTEGTRCFSRLVSSKPMFGNKMTACDETRFQVEPVISRLADFYAFILKCKIVI